jgi:hypothetical protein
MRTQRIVYTSPVDALVAISKRLNQYEAQYSITSEEFYDQFCKGAKEDSIDFVEWSNDYQHYLALRRTIEKQLKYAA